ncbi:MAG: hypothetical protein DMG21_19280 [Acidobacteria bacterium]|nr:MAG: hypothetical protein DMG21_19280 [Acidobacteriota bacterium]
MNLTGTFAGLGTTAMLVVLLLGAFHGINPGMGWLFAVALGMQERSGAAVGRSLVPIALGHAMAIGAVVLLALLLGTVIPLTYIKIAVALILLGFGVYCLFRQRHPRGGGMRVGFGDLTAWSFFMASAHGAGFMVLPVLLGSFVKTTHSAHAASGMEILSLVSPMAAIMATVVHTMGYLAVTGLIAWVVYRKLGLALLRKAWINLHLVWAVALVLSAAFTLLT